MTKPRPDSLRTPDSLSWSSERYPLAMIGLPPEVRERAIGTANALRARGHAQARAIALGIARAWSERDDAAGHTPAHAEHDTPAAAPARHVVFEDGAWVVAIDGLDEPLRRFTALDEALHHAHELASQDEGIFYVYVDQGAVDRPIECFGRPWSGGPSLFQVMPYDGGWAVHRIAGDSPFFETLDTAPPRRDGDDDDASGHSALRIA